MARKNKLPKSCNDGNLSEETFTVLKYLLDSCSDDESTLDGIADAIVTIMGKPDAKELAYCINERMK